MRRFIHWPILGLLLLPLFGCASTYQSILFPEEALTKVDQTAQFSQIKESPSFYEGTTILVGGEVLAAKRFKDHTRLTILQLPLETTQEPTSDRTQTQGRFMAVQTDFLDPATVPTGSRVTLIGVITGSTTDLLDEMEYIYPTLTIQHLKVWQEAMQPPYWYPPNGYGPYGYAPYWPRRYWYPSRFYYPYW